MKINEEQLKKEEFFNEIKLEVENIIYEDRFREAYDLAKELEEVIYKTKDFKNVYYEKYSQYQKIIIQLKWVGLPIMTESMIENMFRYHFLIMFSIPGYDIWSKLKITLLSIVVFEDRDKFKSSLKHILLNSNDKITKNKIIIQNKEVLPTVANWLNDYNLVLGTGKVNTVSRAQYLVNGDNIKKLDSNEKEKIRILFDLYEKLKLSSLTLEGVEEDIPVDDDGFVGMIRGGIFEPYKEPKEDQKIWAMAHGEYVEGEFEKAKKEEQEIDNLEKMAANYELGSLERRAVEEEIRKLKLSIRYQNIKK